MVEMEQFENPSVYDFPSLSDRFLFTSRWKSLLTDGCFRRLTSPVIGNDLSGAQFSAQAETAFREARLAGIRHPVIAGAIPFDPGQPSELFIPESCRFIDRDQLVRAAKTFPAFSGGEVTGSRLIPDQPAFMTMVSRAIEAMKRGEADKVVLSRLQEICSRDAIDMTGLMTQIVRQNPDNYHFHLPLSCGATLLGASPELLLRKEGENFYSCPLAGSAGRSTDPAEDSLRGWELMNSEKDRREHQLVTDDMRRTLQPVSQTLSVPDVPHLLTTSTLWHLATDIRGTLHHPHTSALSLAALLHPTPALSGYPHRQALDLIKTLEPFNRQLFGGMVGWCDDQGNGEWVVTIRCATVKEKTVTLFAGAGIIPASDPYSEWRETGIKLNTMLRAFGLERTER
ncbi:isochorismate synthase [Tatumella sp. JGM118]|uniref:isochorismate synthase n=1 Tax=Tatumella sp. JGM118 TaxID=2799796 RepID=UPI001BAEC272|nr:isochorismate synthase [Tatumella sp. JGM118]MBS0910491.1 isochorismate synthase [Tatumella sp. JGM118]